MEFSLKFIGEIDLIAIYAAILSTAIFIWELIRWYRRGPRLEGYSTSNMIIVGGAYEDKNHYIRCNIYNRGNEATTINNVGIIGYKNKKNKKRNNPSFQGVVPQDNSAYSMPYRIEIGGEFSAMCKQNDELIKKSNELDLYYAIYHSFSDEPKLIRIHPIKKKKP